MIHYIFSDDRRYVLEESQRCLSKREIMINISFYFLTIAPLFSLTFFHALLLLPLHFKCIIYLKTSYLILDNQ